MPVTKSAVSIHYELEGPKGAPLVTLSHSLAANLHMWSWQMETLSKYRILRFDTRGHGRSNAPSGAYTVDQLTDDLFGLLDQLEIEATHFVGLSMGGMIGQSAALRDQSRFLSLTLCDTTSAIPAAMAPLWNERIATAETQGMAALVQPTIDRWFSAEYQQSNPDDVQKIKDMIAATPVSGFCGCCHAVKSLNITERLSAIRRPTLLIVGENDPGTPVAAHETIRDRIAGSRLEILPGALHFSNVEQQAAFNEVLIEFLDQHSR